MIYDMPPVLQGTPQQQLAELRNYLVRLARQQQQTQGSTVVQNGTIVKRVGSAAAGTADAETMTADIEALKQRAVTLRQLIVKTADNIDNRIEQGEAVLLHIDSSRGTVFKNNEVSTVLQVVLYKGGNRITDAETMHAVFGQNAYLQWSWQRLNEDRFGIISAEDSRISEGGFRFTLSPEDVDVKVTFTCELIVE